MAKRTLKNLASDLRNLADGLATQCNEAKKTAARAMMTELTDLTRVDTSAAVSNWRATTGAPASPIPPHVPGRKGSTAGPSTAQALAEAEVVIAAVKPGQTLTLFNTVGHIKYLDEGTAHIPPAGFKERAIMEGRRALGGFKWDVSGKRRVKRGR